MSQVHWSLRDAQNKFSSVVDAARRGEPQTVTRHGIPAVVVIAVEEYERLHHLEENRQPTFNEHLLAMPKDDGEFERATVAPRDFIP